MWIPFNARAGRLIGILSVLPSIALAAAEDPRYFLETHEIELCGASFTRFRVLSGSKNLDVFDRESISSFTKPRILKNRPPVLPGAIRRSIGGVPQDLALLKQVRARSSQIIALQSFPLLRPIPTLLDDWKNADWCKGLLAERTLWKASADKSPLLFKTPLLSVTLHKNSFVIRLAPKIQLEPDFIPPTDPGAAPGTTPLVEAIFYSSDSTHAAQLLAAHRNSRGVPTAAFPLDSIPGQDVDLPAPTQCEGAFYGECYHLSSQDPRGPDLLNTAPISNEAIPSLFGLVNRIPAGTAWKRIPDLAGLTRAEIRRLKILHPELRYIVFIGDPEKIPLRYSSFSTSIPYSWEMQEKTPSDLYFREVFRPWTYYGILSVAPAIELGWPPSPVVYDTRNFRWPLRYPVARVFSTPSSPWLTNPEIASKVLAVGRILNRPEANLRKKDVPPSAASRAVEKIIAWEQSPTHQTQAVVTAADGVYEKTTLQGFESSLGAFRFFGEGFGSGYPLADPSPSCLSSRPPQDDWHMLNDGYGQIYNYQSRLSSCSPIDSSLPYSWQPRFPDPREVFRYMAKQGALAVLMAGHGSPDIIGLASNQMNIRPRRLFAVPNYENDPENSLHDGASMDTARWAPGARTGLLMGPACSPGSYMIAGLGRAAGRMKPTFAEALLSTERAGSTASYLNYHEGYYVSDPDYDLGFFGHYAVLRNSPGAASKIRWGDVLRRHFQDHGTYGWYVWQSLNRFYFGDPGMEVSP